MQRILFLSVLLLSAILPGKAQQDDPITFRFIQGNDMFFLQNNEKELERMFDYVDRSRSEIVSGNLPVYVNGWCISFSDPGQNLKMARVRSNRVKSELIVRKGLKEEHFVTENRAESFEGVNDIVIVSFRPANKISRQQEFAQPESEKESRTPEPEVATQHDFKDNVVDEVMAPPSGESFEGERTTRHFPLRIRTNLLYWLAGTPNLGVEWQASESVGILGNGAFSHWIWNDRDRQHRTWFVQPEMRYYPGTARRWFVGAEFHAGEFNFKFNDTGRQGNAIGGGLTGGYCINLSRVFDMDFSVGLGYTKITRYETYLHSNDVMIRKERKADKNFWGPTQAGVSLVWKIN